MLGYCRNGFWKAYRAVIRSKPQTARHKTLEDFIAGP
jgi:hypothetical protein